MGFPETDQILEVLHKFNPWWTSRAAPAPPPFRRIAFDACTQSLLNLELRRGVLLSGPRRVGKSTVLAQLADWLVSSQGVAPRRVVYLSLDNPFLRLTNLAKIISIYETHIMAPDSANTIFLLLDEVQYSKDWDGHLKTLIDHEPWYRIVATGSAALKQKHDTIDSGVGRWTTIPMPTLSFYEFLMIRRAPLPDIPAEVRAIDLLQMDASELRGIARAFRPTLAEFQRYLLVGGFPETALLSNTDECQRLIREDIVERVLRRDMAALFKIRNVDDLERLFIFLCYHTGSVLSVKSCAKEIGVNPTTVTAYLEALENANLVFKLSPLTRGGKQMLREQHKYYLTDAALRNAVLLRGEEIQTDPSEMGIIVETAVLRHLYAYYYRDTPKISYWRDHKTKKEVDAIVKSPKYVIPVEVKYRADAELEANSGLVKYAEEDILVRHAYLVTREDKHFGCVIAPGSAAKVMKIPAHIFTFLLGRGEHLAWERTRKQPLPFG